MRILHVIPSLAERDGGPSKAVVEICGELGRRGHEAEIYTTNVDGDGCLTVPLGRPIAIRGVAVTYFPVNGNYYKISLAMGAALREKIRRSDVVHAHALYQFPSTAAAHYCRRYGVPYFVQPHGSLDPYLYRRRAFRKRVYEALVERRNLAAAAVVLFTSVEEMMLAKSSGLCFRGAVVPLGVEIDEPATAADSLAEALWPELARKKVVLFLSRINFKKGLDILARAFGAIHRARPDAHLVIAGPDTDGYGAQVRGWLAREGALDVTTFTGMVLGEKKVALLRRANFFVLPSYTENFGIAVVEAMRAGLPVVISNRVNIWREIDAARAGLVVNPNAREVAQATLMLLDNPQLAKEMGDHGRRLAREKFSWQGAGDQLVRLYQEVVAGRLPAPTTGMPSAAAG